MGWQPVFVLLTQTAADKGETVVRLPTNVKRVSAVKLVGYHLDGFGSGLPPSVFGLYIKELGTNNNTVITSDNVAQSWSGAFHVCQSTMTTSFPNFFTYATPLDALACATFNARNMPTLTLELRDIDGNTVTDGTGRFWLQILTEC